MSSIRLAAGFALAAAILPATASAGTATAPVGAAVNYQAAAGEINDLIASETTADWVFTENTGVPITPGTGCRRGATPSQALCAKDPFSSFVTVHLGDGADRGETLDGLPAQLSGEGGDDLLIGAGFLAGGPGTDDLSCSGGRCAMQGGTGPDRMRGLLDPKFPGGRGSVTYDDHSDGVTITVDGVNDDGNATDGPEGLRDNVTAVDRIDGSDGDDRIVDGPGEDHALSGLAGDDELRGLGGRDALVGGMGTDQLYGGDGDDSLLPDNYAFYPPRPYAPGDVSSGGAGRDSVDYTRGPDVRISLDGVANDGTDEDGDGVVEEGDDVRADVEDVHTADGDDVIVGSPVANALYGGQGDDQITGGGGADRLDGSFGEDKLAGGDHDDVLDGGPDADVLSGGPAVDRLSGGPGPDALDGGTGADVLAGGTGLDTVSYANRSLRIFVTMAGGADDGADNDGDGRADEGDDVRTDVENLVGGSGPDRLRGNAAANRLDGGPGGGDYLYGLEGNDVLDGGATAVGDVLDGGPADDRILQGKLPDGNDGIVGGSGTDTVDYSARAGAVDVTLDSIPGDGDTASAERDNVYDDVEVALGGAGADLLTGSPVDNRLSGGAGDDVLDGGYGADDLSGGPDADSVTYATRTGPVTADLDGLADDGTTADADASSARDRIRTDVERLIGGSGADTLTGNGFANRLTGGGGADSLTGGGAADQLFGGDGNDRLFSRGDGAADADACEAGAADEVTADAADTTTGCEVVH
ncbi:MAG TPA: calcium-binding protein [Solirubrobacteraceae bacterium]|jgi:Ca2+-binding RTX toxin-like protein